MRTIMLLLGLELVAMSVMGQDTSTHDVVSPKGLTLDSLLVIADNESQLLRSSQTAREAAREGRKAARSQLLPEVNLSVSGSYTGNAAMLSRSFSTNGTVDYIVPGLGPQQVALGKQPTPHWGNNFALEVNQVLYAGGAISTGIRMAELGQQMAELDVQKNRQEIRFLMTGYYLELQKLANQRVVIDKNIEITRQLIADTERRVEQGIVLPNDLTRFELQLQQLTLASQQVQDAQDIIRYQITKTLHLPVDSEFATIDAASLADHAMVGSHDDWQRTASQSHIGLQQASLAQEIATQQLKATRAASLPHVGLQIADILGGPYTQDLIPTDVNTNVWYVGIGIQYELSSLYRNNHAKRKARLDVRKAQEEMQLAQEGVSQGVQATYVSYLTAFKEVQTQEKSVQLAHENYDVINNRYANQLCLLTDLLDATNAKQSAELALVNARINLLYNYYKLKYVTNTL